MLSHHRWVQAGCLHYLPSGTQVPQVSSLSGAMVGDCNGYAHGNQTFAIDFAPSAVGTCLRHVELSTCFSATSRSDDPTFHHETISHCEEVSLHEETVVAVSFLLANRTDRSPERLATNKVCAHNNIIRQVFQIVSNIGITSQRQAICSP